MRWIAAARERLEALCFRGRQDNELDEELRFHLEQEAELLRQAGLDQQQAWRAAQLRFGGVAQCKEDVREARGLRLLEDVAKDLTIAARSLARRPAFALGAALTLGLGIGATSTLYAVVDGVMLRRLPYEEPSALVTVGSVSRTSALLAPGVQDLGPISIFHYQHLRERARSFEALAAVNTERLMPLSTADGGQEEIPAREVSFEVLEMLGAATPVLGRAFLPEEYGSAVEGAVMITYEEWHRRYGGDPGIVGRTIGRIRGGRFPATVVGVLPPDFRPLEAFFASGETPGYYFPEAPEQLSDDRGWERWYVVGRLRPGVSMEQARAEVQQIGTDVARELPEAAGSRLGDGSRYRIGLNGLQAQTVGASGRVLGLFMAAAGLLLLLAAMNAAMLLVVRSLDRTREFGMRIALGAGRTRIVRLLMSEAGILAVAGGAFGVLLAYAGVEAFVRYAPPSIPRLNMVAVDARVLAVATGVSLGTGIVVGLLPALRLARRGPWERLQRSGHPFAEPASRLRAVLIGGQMALALVLLACAGLLFNSFVRMRALDPGFEADGIVAITERYKDAESVAGLSLWRAWDRVLDELRAVPGVESVAGTTTVPFQSPFRTLRVRRPIDTQDTWSEAIAGYAITPGYLETMGTELLQGRDFERLDGPDTERVALVNESFVRAQFEGGDPIGTVVRLSDNDAEVRIVGVVADVIQRRAEEGFQPALYVPYTQYNQAAFVVAVVRTPLPAAVIIPDLHGVSARLNPGRRPVIVPMRDLMATTRTNLRFQAMLIGAFALVATMLAAAGLYGAMIHFVGCRRRELAVRMALGADRACVLGMVFRQGMRLTIGGLAVGLIATLFLAQTLAASLYAVEPHDPATLLTVSAVLMLVSAAACLVPAHWATAVDPVTVLKAE